MPTTPNGLPYPPGDATPDVPYWQQQLAEALDSIAGDTGWVDITLRPGFAWQNGNPAQVRRIGSVVYARWGWASTNMLPSESNIVGDLPAGFYPAESVYVMSSSSNAESPGVAVFGTSGDIQIRTGQTLGTYYLVSGVTWTIN